MKKKALIHTLYFAAIGLVFGGVLAIASNVTIPNSFVAGETAVAADVNANFTEVETAVNGNYSNITSNVNRLAALEAALANVGACPADMVKVGSVCVDIYEASVWDNYAMDATGTQYGVSSDDYPCGDNGNDCSSSTANPIYARSVAGVTPARFITWFQAQQACANSGKRLITNAEWQMAAAGTDDSAVDAACKIGGMTPDNTGDNVDCTSNWGAYDMVGNVWEWTAGWMHGSTAWSPSAGTAGSDYGDDYIYGTNAALIQGTNSTNQPAALIRGGRWDGSNDAGVFALRAGHGPSDSDSGIGFRCAK